MFCSNCGSELNGKFCSSCGAGVIREASPSAKASKWNSTRIAVFTVAVIAIVVTAVVALGLRAPAGDQGEATNETSGSADPASQADTGDTTRASDEYRIVTDLFFEIGPESETCSRGLGDFRWILNQVLTASGWPPKDVITPEMKAATDLVYRDNCR